MKSFGIGSQRPGSENNVEEDTNNNDSSWPSSLIAKNISYEVPLKTKSAGINIRKLVRKVTVKLAGKKVSASVGSVAAEEQRNSWTHNDEAAPSTITLLDHVDVHFRRGRMTCLMGTSGAGKVSHSLTNTYFP